MIKLTDEQRKALEPIITGLGLLILACVVLGIGIWAWKSFSEPSAQQKAFTPMDDRLLYIRDLNDRSQDNPANIISQEGPGLRGGIPLTEACSKEQKGRYGFDQHLPNGVGGTAIFKQVVGKGLKAKLPLAKANTGKPEEEVPFVKGWQKYQEEGKNDLRQEIVKNGCALLAQKTKEFMQPVELVTGRGIVLDRTSGIDGELRGRIQATLDKVRALLQGTLTLFELTASRQTLTRPDEPAHVALWMEPVPALRNSAVFGGLKDILGYVSTKHDVYLLHIYTDGLENALVSLYNDPYLLLDKSKWGEIDQHFDLTGLNLTGVTIHLHPLRTWDERSAQLEPYALDYLKSRLEAAGATVILESYVGS